MAGGSVFILPPNAIPLGPNWPSSKLSQSDLGMHLLWASGAIAPKWATQRDRGQATSRRPLVTKLTLNGRQSEPIPVNKRVAILAEGTLN